MPPKKPRANTPRRLAPLGIYRISGDSMRPTYAPGDTLLGWRWVRTPRPGRVIVARDPATGRPLIKRLHHLTGEHHLYLLGDNPAASTDSRSLGPFPPATLEAVIIVKLP